MSLTVISDSAWIVFFVVASYNGVTQAQQPESCFLYRVQIGGESPSFELHDDYESHVTINDIFRNFSKSEYKVLDEHDNCIAALNSPNDGICPINFWSDKEYTSLVFRRRGDGVTVYKRDDMDSEEKIEGQPKTIKIHSTGPSNIAFNCPGNCYQFENAFIHKSLPKDVNEISLRIYGKITNTTEANNPRINVRRGDTWTTNGFVYLNNLMLDSPPENQWLFIDILASCVKTQQSGIKYDMNATFNGSFLKGSQEKTGLVISRDLYLDFKNTSGIRWALFCRPYEKASRTSSAGDTSYTIQQETTEGIDYSENPTEGIDNSENPTEGIDYSENPTEDTKWILYICIAASGCGIIIIVCILLCIYACQLKRRVDYLNGTTHQDAVKYNGPTEDDHEYAYIDHEVLQKQLEKEKSVSQQILTAHEEHHDTAQRRNSHTSINSIYGFTGKTDAQISNSNGRRASYTSINSLYGCTGEMNN